MKNRVMTLLSSLARMVDCRANFLSPCLIFLTISNVPPLKVIRVNPLAWFQHLNPSRQTYFLSFVTNFTFSSNSSTCPFKMDLFLKPLWKNLLDYVSYGDKLLQSWSNQKIVRVTRVYQLCPITLSVHYGDIGSTMSATFT